MPFANVASENPTEVRSRVPGLASLKARQRQRTEAVVSVRLRSFEALESLSPVRKREIEPYIRGHLHDLTRFEVLVSGVRWVFSYGFLIELVLVFLGAPLVVAIWLDPSYSTSKWVVSLLAYVPLALVLGALALSPPFLFATRRAVAVFLLLAIPIVEGLLLVDLTDRGEKEPTSFEFFLGSAFTASMLAAMLFLLLFLGVSAVAYFAALAIRRTHPDALVVDSLLRTLARLERSAERWSQLTFKCEVMAMLEEVATRLEMVARRLRGRDAATDAWLTQRGEEMSAGMRAEKKGLLSAGVKHRERLVSVVGDSLVHSATGDWELMRRTSPEKVSKPRRTAEAAQTVLVGLLPAALVFSVQQTSYAFEGGLKDYATFAAVLWLVLVLLVRIDPLFSQHLEGLKGLLGPVPFGGGNGSGTTRA